MADTVAQLVADVQTEGGFDTSIVDATRALRWINRRWRRMHARAKSYRKTVTVGTTVAGTSFYAFNPIEAFDFYVGGVPYGRARHDDVYGVAQNTVVWSGPGGLIVPDADSTGARGITLVPTPTTGGDVITAFAAVAVPDLTSDGTGDTLLNAQLDSDLIPALIDGAVAEGLNAANESRPDLAQAHEQAFADAVETLRRRTARRYRGSGPNQIRVAGINA